jgi:hypothetical protein
MSSIPDSISAPSTDLRAVLSKDKLRWGIAALLLAGAFIYLFWPLHVLSRGWNDFAWVYAAGRNWDAGFSPYDIAKWRTQWSVIVPSFADGHAQTQPFMYPPHWAPIAAALALLPWPIAMRIWDLVNVASCVALWECQMALLPTLGVLGMFWAMHEKKTAWLAVFAYLASLKPQIGLLPIIYVFLNGGFLGVLWGGLAAAVVSMASIPFGQWANLPAQLHESYALHMSISYNAPSYFFNLSALLAQLPHSDKLLFISSLLGMVCVLVLTGMRQQNDNPLSLLRDPKWTSAIVMALVPAFVPLHGYDLVMYTPLVVLAHDLRPRYIAYLIVFLVTIAARAESVGQRLHIPIYPLPPYFTLAVIVLLGITLRNALRAERAANLAGS